MKYYLKKLTNVSFAIGLFIFLLACDAVTPELVEIDENGNVISNSGIDIQNSLADLGISGYSIDTIYTQFKFDERNNRIVKIRKGITKMDGAIVDSIVWSGDEQRITYAGSAIVYNSNGIRSEILLNSHFFAEAVENKTSDGNLVSRILYYYDDAGYLKQADLERPGHTKVIVYYSYIKDNNIVYISEPSNEGFLTYSIPLMVRDSSEEVLKNLNNANYGYICNVLNYGNAPLTNTFIINPDLYYLGVYGTPIRDLPKDQHIEMSVNSKHKICISRIGRSRYYYTSK